jgi:hypothetical protein
MKRTIAVAMFALLTVAAPALADVLKTGRAVRDALTSSV